MEDGSKYGEMVAGERGRREKGDNAIISIADIAISACALPRRGTHYVACLGDFSRTPCISAESISSRLEFQEKFFRICECKYWEWVADILLKHSGGV